MEYLKITSETVEIEINIYGRSKTWLRYAGFHTYPKGTSPECFDLPDDTVYFTVREKKTLTTSGGKEYYTKVPIASVYMGDTIPIEDAIKRYPEKGELPIANDRDEVTRAVITKDGYVSAMEDYSITYKEYCDQYKTTQDKVVQDKMAQDKMEYLEIASKTVKAEIDIFVGSKTKLRYAETTYPKDMSPECFNLPDDTVYFDLEENETLTTSDGKEYHGRFRIVSVYMGDAIPIEDAIKRYPENRGLSFSKDTYGATRVAIREDGYVSSMLENDITYKEYCDQYKTAHDKVAQDKVIQSIKVKNTKTG